jgi:two-component system OmpR family response regulator
MAWRAAAAGLVHEPTGLRVLVAEDHPDGAASLAHLLRLAGHAVLIAPDGPTAVAAALGDRPEVLLLDIGLPGLDGWDVARRVRAAAEGRPCLIVAITGYSAPADRERSRDAGIDAHLVKPIDPDVLLADLARYRAGRAGGL